MDIEQEKEILKPLVEELLKFSLLPVQGKKKEMWAEHQSLNKSEKTPVSVYYEGIPVTQWDVILGSNFLQTESELARGIEFDLRKRLWMIKNVPDDHIVWPLITISSKLSRPVDWGVKVKWVGTDENDKNPEHAKMIEPPFKDTIELARIKFTDMAVDEIETEITIEMASELIGGKLSVFAYYDNLGYSPFDIAVELRGLENLLFDVVDAPDKVKELLQIITDSLTFHHKNREKRGWINAPTVENKYIAFPMRVHCAYLSEKFDQKKLKLTDEWAYVSAQTSSGLGPDMYAEFVHPYNAKLAELFMNKTVYYHGCENLDQKANIIETLPNLRRFHISPWSSIKEIRTETNDTFVYEVHDHPGRVFFGMSKNDMKKELTRLVNDAKGSIFDLNLSDIHNVNKNPMLLKYWAEAAQEAVQEIQI